MKTLVFDHSTGSAADILRAGGLVAVPTETVYGLAANGLDAEAVAKIYEVKGRPAVKPLSLMVPGQEAMEKYASSVPPEAKVLAEHFWPGPLTIVLPAKDCIPSIVLAGGKTVGLRCPDCALTLEALRAADVPFAAPSANPSGEPSPKDAALVLQYFDGKIDAVIDGGACTLGKESTIIDLTARPFRILRQGALAADEIAKALLPCLKVIGITGGTGAGKTTLLNYIGRCGGRTIDCDEVYHRLLESSDALKAELFEAFPAAFPDGQFDRKALGRIVFADAAALQKLNTISHAHVAREVDALLLQAALEGAGTVAIDAVELCSSGLADRCDVTISVLAAEETRAERIQQRDGISHDYALSRISAQRDDAYYITHSNCVLRNDGTPEDLIAQYERFMSTRN